MLISVWTGPSDGSARQSTNDPCFKQVKHGATAYLPLHQRDMVDVAFGLPFSRGEVMAAENAVMPPAVSHDRETMIRLVRACSIGCYESSVTS